MNMNNFTIAQDLTMVSVFRQDSSYIYHDYYYFPFIGYIIILLITLFIFNRIILEIIIRLRK